MSNRKTWKSVGALLLTLAMLAGMLSVMGALPATAKTTSAMKYKVDFSELTKLVTDNGGTFTNGLYRAPFTPASDTESLEGKFNTWANEKFATYQTHPFAARAYFGQDSNNLQTSKDTWSGNQYLAAGENGYMKFYTDLRSGQMLRKGILLSPLQNGELTKLKNFEASLTFQFTYHSGNGGNAVVLNFHETTAGYMYTNTDYKAFSTGNTVVFGNGRGSYKGCGNEGVAFYQAGDTMSATSVDDAGNTNSANTAEIKLGDKGVRFENALSLNHDYTLKVKAVNGKATVTVLDAAAGTDSGVEELYTVTKDYTTTDGYLSFGFYNAAMNVKDLEVAELDDKGDLVDFGTYAASLTDGVSRFTASFTDVPDVMYNAGTKQYYYSTNHDGGKFASATADQQKVMTLGDTTYQIDMNDDALVDYLESKFAFYYQQEGWFFNRQRVNGFMVDADGNQGTSGTVYTPDTKTAKTVYVDSIHNKAYSHFWGLSANKFIATTNNTNNGDSMYRHADAMTVKNADGTLAQFENFELDMDFILRTDATYDYANLTVAFRSPSPLIQRGNVDTALFALSPYGGYTVGGSGELSLKEGYIFNKTNKAYDAWSSDTAITFTKQTITNTATNQKSAIYAKNTGVNFGTSEYHLNLRVVGKNVTFTISDTKGNVKFQATEQTTYAGAGYLVIGGSNNAARFGEIAVTRLDRNGNAVDFEDTNEGYAFGASFGNLAEYRTGAYYSDNGADLFNLTNVDNPYAFNDETPTGKAISDYLREKFDFYANKEGTHAQLANPYTNTKDADIGDATDTQHHGQWELEAGRYLAATFRGGTRGNGEMFRKSMSLVPKMNGSAVKVSNFETEFDVKFNLNKNSIYNSEVGAMLAFRSEAEGSVADGWYNVPNNKDAILLHPTGIGIYDGVAVDYSYSLNTGKAAGCIKQSDGYCDEFTAWDGGDAWAMHVYVKLVGKTLEVKVTELGSERVLFEGTKTISRMGDGYLYYTVAGAEVGFADIRLNLLGRDGEVRTAEETATEGYASMTATAAELRAAAGWDTSKNLFPNSSASIDDVAAKKYGVFDSYSDYVNARYDLYYQNQATLVKHKSVFGNDAGDKGWYSYANYWGFMQFKCTTGITLNTETETEIDNTVALVPKTADGAQMKGKDCIADMTFRFDNHDGAALFGFRMAEAGRFTDKNWNPDANASFLKMTLSGVTLYDKGVETSLVDYSYTPVGNLQMGLHVEVIGNQLTGYVTKGSDKHTFSATLTNTATGYFAQGFGDTGLHFIPMSIMVSDMNIAKATQTAGGKLTVARTASDRDGYLAWKVTVNADADEQLKPNTLMGTDADGTKLYPTRAGFRSDDHDSNTFVFYSKGDATFTADFYTPHTAQDVAIPCLGTSVNTEKAGLRFVNRVNLYTDNGVTYTDIDGVQTEVKDYGVLVALNSTLNGRDLTCELAAAEKYVVKRSVLTANKYYDYSNDYVDMAVQITGLRDSYADAEVCSRAYLELANGTVIYSTMAQTTYNHASA